MDGPRNDVPSLATAPSRTVLCPACGYDLRGMTADRCSECGLVIDPEVLRRSAVPWAHRKSVGRVRAFLRTAWMVTGDGKALRQEAAKEQSARDGAWFRRWVAAVLAACCLFIAGAMVEKDALKDMVVQPHFVYSATGGMPGWQQDLVVPWSAGLVIRPAFFVYAVLVAFYVSRAPGLVLHTRGMAPDYAEAVRAIGGYVSAPLFWILPCLVGYVAAFWLMQSYDAMVRRTPLVPIVICLAFLVGVAGVVATVYRTGQWRARTTDHSFLTGLLGAGELLARWVAGGAVILGVVPWCVGFVWIVIDSLR